MMEVICAMQKPICEMPEPFMCISLHQTKDRFRVLGSRAVAKKRRELTLLNVTLLTVH